ncbi:MAG: MobC family plasmid mobilization relaxosome protein [Bacteroidaceae bacterium]|nr:MobC family plasmid mobilization relaxosome protein [Bacteroidaceae bacterium]
MKKRHRTHQVKIRMTEAEYRHLKIMTRKSGMTQQGILLSAFCNVKATTPEEIEQLKETNKQLKTICQNIRAIGNNINQIAKYANQCAGINPSDVLTTQKHIRTLNKEVTELWQYSRYVIQRLQGTPH